jgi:hypothetical protein
MSSSVFSILQISNILEMVSSMLILEHVLQRCPRFVVFLANFLRICHAISVGAAVSHLFMWNIYFEIIVE